MSPYGYGRLPPVRYIRVNLDSLIMDMQDLFIYTIHICLLAGWLAGFIAPGPDRR